MAVPAAADAFDAAPNAVPLSVLAVAVCPYRSLVVDPAAPGELGAPVLVTTNPVPATLLTVVSKILTEGVAAELIRNPT
jgi:hypothetical protein